MTSSNRASVSVVIPYYNREEFIEEALDSVLRQTRKPDEIIVVDDASNPQSAEFLQRFSNQVQIVTLPQNRGPAYARNVGVENASGNLIAFQDSDDVWEPTKLEEQVSYMQVHSECSAVHTGCVVFFHDGHEVQYLSKPSPLSIEDLIASSHVTPPSLVIRTDVFQSVGGFDSSLRVCEDYEFSMHLVTQGYRIDFIPKPLTRVRRVGHSSASAGSYGFLIGHVRVVWRYRRYYRKLKGRGATRQYIAKYVRAAGRKRGGIIGRSVFAGGWLLGRQIPD